MQDGKFGIYILVYLHSYWATKTDLSNGAESKELIETYYKTYSQVAQTISGEPK